MAECSGVSLDASDEFLTNYPQKISKLTLMNDAATFRFAN